MMYALVSLGITCLMLLLSIAFKAAGKLRLTIPLLYFLAISTVLNRWASAHEMLALGILGLLVLIAILSWFSSLAEAIKDRRRARAMEEDIAWQIGRARQMGVSMSDVYIDGNGDMRYCDDDTPVI
ncbi:hypothetical protein LC724_16405 [Blautia sp. RD014234]|nr:hypothetical protein [Blautia parvula]